MLGQPHIALNKGAATGIIREKMFGEDIFVFDFPVSMTWLVLIAVPSFYNYCSDGGRL